jgi:hypothetical protein
LTTPLDSLVVALHEAATFNAAAEAAPVAVVWGDVGSDFLPLISALRERMPELLAYGDIDPATRTGPAAWLRAATVGSLDAVTLPEGTTPIIDEWLAKVRAKVIEELPNGPVRPKV